MGIRVDCWRCEAQRSNLKAQIGADCPPVSDFRFELFALRFSGKEAPVTSDYRVQLTAFEGPLDLLLFLIRRAEVDITDIPLATIADQYMAYLTGIDRIDI